MEAYVNGKKIALNPKNSIGKGGEADVFKIGNTKALKLFKKPDHIDYTGMPEQQLGAKLRLAEHQKKLRVFPKNLPDKVVTPIDLAFDKGGKNIVGYTMNFLAGAEPLIKYAQKNFRQLGISNQLVMKIFCCLYDIVKGLHDKKVIIGDFNDLNVMVRGEDAFVIDADSFQFLNFYSRMFTVKFLDPLLCDRNSSELKMVRPYLCNSDWYAFSVMLMQCLLYVDPYGGIYKPKDKTKKASPTERILRGITVFDKEVAYPKPAVHYKVLPDDLLHYFEELFAKDQRGIFPRKIIDDIYWTKCSHCGIEHARSQCPDCAQVAPAAIKQTIVVRGNVVSTQVFKTKGVILFAAHQGGKLRWLVHENNSYQREDGSVIYQGRLDSQVRYRVLKDKTLLGKNGQVVLLKSGLPAEKFITDSYKLLPMFDANEENYFFIQNDQLMRSGEFGNEYIGDVLSGQTLFWTGPQFGFGFYRAGNLNVAFVFNAKKRGINDNVMLPRLSGQLIDATCFFTEKRCWFLVNMRDLGKTINHCIVIKQNGEVEASIEKEAVEGDWIYNLRGKCSAGNFLLAATDDGVSRIEIVGNKIVMTKIFPDTEAFVNSESQLFLAKEGLYVVNQKEIKLLKIT